MRLLVFFALVPLSASAPAATLAVAPFTAVELRSGGEVVVRHGPSQQVELVAGDARAADIVVHDGRLVIDHCPRRCRHGDGFRVEIVVPRLDAARVESGGSIEVLPGFPGQETALAEVSNGGIVDIRGIPAASVSAAVDSGGLILTRPGERLDASVRQGGIVTYWGDPAVRRSVSHGGAVVRGEAADAARPLAALRPRRSEIPPVPPLPTLH